jgi:hypothetical protein
LLQKVVLVRVNSDAKRVWSICCQPVGKFTVTGTDIDDDRAPLAYHSF